MNRVRSPFFKLSLLLFAFCLPAGVQGQETKKEKADLVKQFDDLQNSLKNAFAGVGQDIKYLQAQINSLKENQSTYDAQLKALEERVKALESGTTKSPEDNGPEVVSKKPPTPPVPPTPPSPPVISDGGEPSEKKVTEAKSFPLENPDTEPPAKEPDSQEISKVFQGFKEFLQEKLKGISKEVQSIQAEVQAMKDNSVLPQMKLEKAMQRIDDLETQVKQLQSDMTTIKDKLATFDSGYTPSVQGMDAMKKQLAQLEKQLQNLAPTQTRIAKSLPTERGRIVLINNYPGELIFIINDVSYRLPGESARVIPDLEPGRYRYEVMSETHGRLKSKEFTLGTEQPINIVAE